MLKTIEESIREMILEQYGTIKTFSNQANIPNSTIASILKRGVMNSNIDNVIQLAKALEISVDALVEGKIEYKKYSTNTKNDVEKQEFQLTYDESQLIRGYRQLTNEGKDSIQRLMIMHVNTYKKGNNPADMEISKELA